MEVVMNLTPENKAYIDSLTYYQLSSKIRICLSGDPWFQGETGNYWIKRCSEKWDEHLKNAQYKMALNKV